MLYANDPTGEKITATPHAAGNCPGCAEDLVPKCGQIVSWHWSHRANRDCDSWFEPETEWHRAWKACFPRQQVEVTIGPHRADAIAESNDVLPERTVLEFQHSAISTEDIQERERFYTAEVGEMAWVFDASEYRDALEVKPLQADRIDRGQLVRLGASAPAVGMMRCGGRCNAWRFSLGGELLSCWSCKQDGPIEQSAVRCTRHNVLLVQLVPDEVYCPLCHQHEMNTRGLGNYPIQPSKDTWRPGIGFRWRYPRRSQMFCEAPLYWDLGNDILLHVRKLYWDKREGDRDKRVGGWGQPIAKRTFLAWYGGQVPKPQERPQHAAAP